MSAIVVLAACTSSRTPNAQLHARVDAKVDVYRHTLGVALDLDDGTVTPFGTLKQFEIEPDEHVRIGFRDQTLDLLYSPGNDSSYGYGGRLPLADELVAGEEIRVEVERNDEDAVTLTAPAPQPIALVGPQSWTKSEDLTITWTPISSEPMTWESGVNEGPIPTDTGTITFPAGVLVSPSAQGTIEVGIALSRIGQTQPVSAFRSSSFSITQASYIVVQETP